MKIVVGNYNASALSRRGEQRYVAGFTSEKDKIVPHLQRDQQYVCGMDLVRTTVEIELPV